MATNGTIAVCHTDGTLTQVYVHWDAYIRGVGTTLVKFYNSQELADKLVSKADICDLGESPDGLDSTFYDSLPSYYPSFDVFSKKHRVGEFDYLYQNGKWLVCFDHTDGRFVPLEPLVAKETRSQHDGIG
jgi:hypothetical protein